MAKSESKKKEKQTKVSPFGGLDTITDEEIMENIRAYPYVMEKLKDC